MKNGELIEHEKFGPENYNHERWVYFLYKIENDNAVLEKYREVIEYDDCDTGKKVHRENVKTVKQQKFLCVNGPLANQKVTEAVAGANYIRYNAGCDARYGKKSKIPTCVLVYFP